MATNSDMTWHLSGGAANTDPNASLGGARSTAGGGTLHDVESTITGWDSAGGFRVFDNALGGSNDDHNGKYLVIMEGAIALYASKVIDYRAVDGRFALLDPLPAAPGAVLYRLFPKNNLFDDATALQSANGTPEYRGIYVFNVNGADTFDPQSLYIVPLDPGPIDLEIYSDDNFNGAPVMPTFADPEVGPSPASLSSFAPSGIWSSPDTFEIGEFTQPNQIATGSLKTLAPLGSRAMFVRRIIRPNQQRRTSVAFMLVSEGTSSGQKRSGAVVHFDVEGFTLDTAGVKFDRTIKVGGGARVAVTVRSVETGQVVEGVEVAYRHSVGPGTLEAPADFSITDEDGKSFASYTAPTSQAQAGQAVEVEVRV